MEKGQHGDQRIVFLELPDEATGPEQLRHVRDQVPVR